MKNPLILSGIEPATFRFVTQHLNHCATAVPQLDALVSQIHFWKLYMFLTVPLSVIRSFSLYTQQRYMSYRFADSLRAGPGRSFLILLASCVYSKKLLMMDRVAVGNMQSFILNINLRN